MKQIVARLAVMAVALGSLASTSAQAANPLGLYVGAGGGYAHQRINEPDWFVTCHGPGWMIATCFDKASAGWTVFAGLKPLPFVGAELQYLDFGHASQEEGMEVNSKRARALALFGTGTLPLAFVDLYVKAGVGRLQTKTALLFEDPMGCLDYGGDRCGLIGPQIDKTAARFGWGLGIQFKLASVGLRGEYVRFSAPNGDPDMLSLALLWKF